MIYVSHIPITFAPLFDIAVLRSSKNLNSTMFYTISPHIKISGLVCVLSGADMQKSQLATFTE